MARVELQDSCPKFPEIRLNTEDDIVVKKSKRRVSSIILWQASKLIDTLNFWT